MGIDLNVQVEGSGWQATATYADSPTDTDREAWTWLLELSPYVKLVMPGTESTHIEALATEGGDGRLTLAAA